MTTFDAIHITVNTSAAAAVLLSVPCSNFHTNVIDFLTHPSGRVKIDSLKQVESELNPSK